jgi:hypothetical protein
MCFIVRPREGFSCGWILQYPATDSATTNHTGCSQSDNWPRMYV